ncbi:MAG: adenylosuccinate synthase [candidate division WOR-3 bacterium]
MPALVVVGTQWGDEGKGKIVDFLAQKADLIARFQGGPNAGHSVKVQLPATGADGPRELALVFHQVPSGLLNPRARCLIGAGCVLDLAVLKEELAVLSRAGIDYAGRLFIDPKAHLILPYHRLLDRLKEENRGQRRIGTTIRGIGPCYEDKYARVGIRFADLLQEDTFTDRLRRNLAFKNFLIMELYHAEPLAERPIRREYLTYAEEFRGLARNGSLLVESALRNHERVLFEGAQGPLLDIDHGTYPYVTSSSPTAGGASTGIGIGPAFTGNVLGVAKAYTTRVGKGPFPTEAAGDLSASLRRRGREFGATTGRARRCGWFDAPLVRYAVRLNGIRRLAVTKLDILDELPEIPFGIGYDLPDGRLTEFDPLLTNLKPHYVRLPGWRRPTSSVRRLEDLPREARQYLARIEKEVDCEIALVSVGEARGATLVNGTQRWFR